MKRSHDKIRALWIRQLDGEPLLDNEHQLLRGVLHEDPDFVRELSRDATSHTLLHSLEKIIRTEEDFVQATLHKVMQSQAIQSPSPHTETIDGADIEFTASLKPEPSDLLLVETPSNRDRAKLRRRSQAKLAISLTLILFLSIGLTFWLQNRGPAQVAATSPVQIEKNEQKGSDRLLHDNETQSLENQHIAASDDDSQKNVIIEVPENTSTQWVANDQKNSTQNQNHQPILPVPQPLETTSSAVAKRQFVTLTKILNPVWERSDVVSSRFGDERVQLFGGNIELTFDDGAVVTLQGPVEFQPQSASKLTLHRGQLSASVPRKAIGFTVLTPTSEVVDLGTEFDVSVKSTGASDVTVRKGEIEVTSRGLDKANIPKWKLVPQGLNKASFLSKPDDNKAGPIAATVQGVNGQFHGVISLNGKTAEFQSASTFNKVHERVLTELKTSQSHTLLQWQQFVDSMRQQMQGTMNFNGRQLQFGSFDEVMRLQNQLRGFTNPKTSSAFSGSININGKIIQFRTHEEFEAARKAAFGPAANFGAGDFFNTRSQQ